MARQTSFTVHLAPSKPGRSGDEAIQFVPDSFSPVAFIVPWAWFLWNRMWLTFLVYLVGMIAVVVALTFSGFPPLLRMAITFSISLLIGLEATNLKRRSLRRRGFHEVGVVVAANAEEAERRYFAERAEAEASRRGPAPAGFGPLTPAAAPSAHPIGLFHETDPSARGVR
jgi:hypothetical protein